MLVFATILFPYQKFQTCLHLFPCRLPTVGVLFSCHAIRDQDQRTGAVLPWICLGLSCGKTSLKHRLVERLALTSVICDRLRLSGLGGKPSSQPDSSPSFRVGCWGSLLLYSCRLMSATTKYTCLMVAHGIPHFSAARTLWTFTVRWVESAKLTRIFIIVGARGLPLVVAPEPAHPCLLSLDRSATFLRMSPRTSRGLIRENPCP